MSDSSATHAPGLRPALAAWFRPPRAHGDVIDGRTVSFLELFYDLVFVVLVAQIAHTLAGDVSWVGVRDFVAVFVLIWFAWVNGSLYHELHGGEDGRSRTYIFAQMILLVILAVYAGHAAEDTADGRGFAIVYAVLLLQLAWQWYQVRRQDSEEYLASTLRYLVAILVATALVGVSALIDDPAVRVWIWLAAVLANLVNLVVPLLWPDERTVDSLRVTESMAERFGLFTIIVLGEVVVGVADGLSEMEGGRGARTIVTAVVALGIGFGLWWNYFDFVGRRQPRPGPVFRTVWLNAHLPLTLSVAATGAGMVSLVEASAEARTPADTAWLITGSVAAMALSLATLVWTMDARPGRALVPYSLVVAAGVALVIGASRPAPWLLALLLYAALSAVWIEAFVRHARSGVPIAEA